MRATVGGSATAACEQIGAESYAQGNSVAFKQSPSLWLAAHEAAHVVQQQTGAGVRGGIGQVGDAHEAHADRVADRVVAGRSAAELFGPPGGTPTTAVQRYVANKVNGKVGRRPTPVHRWLSPSARCTLKAHWSPRRTPRSRASARMDLASVGLSLVEQLSPADIQARYFAGRSDGHRALEHTHIVAAAVIAS